MPILPVQLLWINMATSLLLGLTLAFEPREKDIMSRPPRNPSDPILTRSLILRIAMVSLIMLAGGFSLFAWEGSRGMNLPERRTLMVNTIVTVEMFYLLNCRSLTKPLASIGLLSNPWALIGLAAMAGMQAMFTYAPFMNRLFHSAPLDLQTWLEIVGLGGLVFILVELKKWLAD